MGKIFGEFKYQIGDVISDNNRNLKIIERFYIQKQKQKNNKTYTSNEKWYKYECLKCGNVDVILETSLYHQKCGCNTCCIPPKKIVKGINDISTTASWMSELIIDKNYIFENAKYSKTKTEFKCPDCGRVHIKTPSQVYSNRGLSCTCHDWISFPNKVLYYILESLDLDFELEKSFDWSDGRIYDAFIKYNDYKIIVEMNGKQHYEKVGLHKLKRSLSEELLNDDYKERLAKNNDIDFYYRINCSVSEIDFVKDNIISSGLFDILNVPYDAIDWNECEKFTVSNLYKSICEYHNDNPLKCRKEVAEHFHVSVRPVQSAIDIGLKYGWCKYSFQETNKERKKIIYHGQKPIYCITDDTYYRSSSTCVEMQSEDPTFNSRALRKSISRNNNYKGKKYIFISCDEFDNAKTKFPDKCFGNFFNVQNE